MRSLLALILLLTAPAWSFADDIVADLQQTNSLLQAEYDLAKNGRIYLIIDLQEHRVHLKGGGLTLVSWGIVRKLQWGRKAAPRPHVLEGKASSADPERDVLVTNSAEPAKSESRLAKAFELDDMPASYRLKFDSGLIISVSPTPDHWYQKLKGAGSLPFWYTTRPLISGWKSLRSSTYNELALSMAAQDASMLYWAFSEDTPCLIRYPAEVAAKAPDSAGANR